jgi:hypothetical protein
MRILMLGGSTRHIGGIESFCKFYREAIAREYECEIWQMPTDTSYLTLARVPGLLMRLLSLWKYRREGIDCIWLQYVCLPDLLFVLAGKLLGFTVMVTPHLGSNWRRIRSGYTSGVGEIMRAAWANEHFGAIFRHLTHVRVCLLILAWWVVMTATAFAFPVVALLLLLAPLAFLSVRRRSVWLGLYSFLTWNIMTAGMIQGLLRRRVAATVPLATIELTAQDGIREDAHRNRKTTNRAGNATTAYEETSSCAF